MANLPVDPQTDFTEITTANGTEIIPAARGGIWGRITLTTIRNWMASFFAASNHVHAGTYEPVLGNPPTSSTHTITSTTAGVRTWVPLGTPAAHATSHATGQSDPLTASDIGAAPEVHTHTGTYEPADVNILKTSTTMGAFTGTTIPDSQTVKQSLQALETAVELRALQSGLPTFPAGAIVGTSDEQTLTNKTLTAPTIIFHESVTNRDFSLSIVLQNAGTADEYIDWLWTEVL